MEKIIDYKPKGTCSQNIQITIDQNIVTRVVFTGGCSGNTQGLGALCAGMTVDELIPAFVWHPVRPQAHLLPRPAGQSPAGL